MKYAWTLFRIDRATRSALATLDRYGLGTGQLSNDAQYRALTERSGLVRGKAGVLAERVGPLLEEYRRQYATRNQKILAAPRSDWTASFAEEAGQAQSLYTHFPLFTP
jgi:hypothetical protein